MYEMYRNKPINLSKLAQANKCIYQSSVMKITVRIENFPQVTELNMGLCRLSKIPSSHYLGYRS